MNAFKSFDNFKDAIQEVCAISQNIKSIFDEFDYNAINYEEAIKLLTKYIVENVPRIDSEEYPNTTAISISANEVGLKCTGQLAFGWRCRLAESGDIVYDFRITINSPTRFAKNSIVLKEAKNKGWRLSEGKKFNKSKLNNDGKTIPYINTPNLPDNATIATSVDHIDTYVNTELV